MGDNMKGMIDGTGVLHIERESVFKGQHCAKDHNTFCGDECPLFGQPFERTSLGKVNPVTVLKICEDRELVFDELEDRRREKEV